MIELEWEIDGPEDFELGTPRSSPLKYEVSWPDHGEAPGLVFVIPGFGGDTDPDYARALRRHVVESTGMAAVNVSYHCIQARPANGGRVRIDAREHMYLIGLAAFHKVPVANYQDIGDLTEQLASLPTPPTAKAAIDPGRGEYQNFGILQALDHLAVLGDLIENAPPFNTRQVIALGSSHGGYIAHLMAKIAPDALAAIIDNSSYTQPPMNYLGLSELSEFDLLYGGALLQCQVKPGWSTSHRMNRNFYGRDQDLIRDTGFLPHLQRTHDLAGDDGTQFFMVNAAVDSISAPACKRRQQAALTRAGFEAHLAIIDQDQIDGRLFKTMTHGLDCSLKALFDRYIGQVVPRRAAPDGVGSTVTTYDCVDRGYRFIRSATAPYMRGEIYELHETHAEGSLDVDHQGPSAVASAGNPT